MRNEILVGKVPESLAKQTQQLNDTLLQFLAGSATPQVAVPSPWSARFCKVLACCGVIAAASGAWAVWQHQQHASREPQQIYYDVRVVDAAGHPVAGANVIIGSKVYGVTDSFGEWRKFLRTRLGATVTLKIEKKAAGEVQTIVKNLVVPTRLAEQGDTQVRASLQFVAGAATAAPPVTRPEPDAKSQLVVRSDVEPGPGWTFADNMRAKQLGDYVATPLQEKLRMALPQVSSVSLRHLAVKGGLGLILVQAESAKAPGRVYKILRNYMNDTNLTVNAIVAGLKQEITGVKVSPGQQRLAVAVHAADLPVDAHVFISGFMAEKRQDNEYVFWGPANGDLNLSIVTPRAGVVYRGRVLVKDGKARPVYIPSANLVRR